jgi:hypothetical protein
MTTGGCLRRSSVKYSSMVLRPWAAMRAEELGAIGARPHLGFHERAAITLNSESWHGTGYNPRRLFSLAV